MRTTCCTNLNTPRAPRAQMQHWDGTCAVYAQFINGTIGTPPGGRYKTPLPAYASGRRSPVLTCCMLLPGLRQVLLRAVRASVTEQMQVCVRVPQREAPEPFPQTLYPRL
eukprot:3298448-Rhodomonas_salina.1